MNFSNYTFTAINKRNISNQRMSPREDCSVQFQSPEGDFAKKLDFLERDSFHRVKNVPRVHLSRLLGDNDDSDSESEFDDLEEDSVSGWFATYVEETTPTKRRSSVSLKAAAPVKRRSSVKYTVPLKEATRSSKKSSVRTGGGNRINRFLNRNKRTTEQDFCKRVRDTRGRDSLHLHRERLQCSKSAAKTTTH
eukprot:CAMPEP_0113621310 /NCGR_PEP_ID=MMETSP0017_2-20120614/10884_1 /TAXON_ID=2856 /ORGANISM="Cylindrotheca closterium" /LENGTH=192 /DNA_ID=CAMNT_0000531041 /DNA_START=18 /DNA_END=596 /DNA_ORIENTATION=+ /assembly_acc=CAM_ASM_000147